MKRAVRVDLLGARARVLGSPGTYVLAFVLSIAAALSLFIEVGISAPAHRRMPTGSPAAARTNAVALVALTSKATVVASATVPPASLRGPLGKGAIALAPDGTKGFWVLHRTGAITELGAATRLCSSVSISEPLSIAATPSDTGFFVTNAAGAVETCGSATSLSTLPAKGVTVNDIVEVVAYAPGGGYWLVGADGGVFAFGAARWWGTAALTSNRRSVVAITPTADSQGYWTVTSTGTLYPFGDATALAPSTPTQGEVLGLVVDPTSGGAWVVHANGRLTSVAASAPESSLPTRGALIDGFSLR